MSKRQRPTAIDLFSGCGGLTEGLKQAGYHVMCAADIDSTAVETYRHNHADVKVWLKDICHLKGSAILKRLNVCKGQIDLLAGCPPCQGYSSLRTLNGSKNVVDVRNDLVFEFLRLVREIKPKAVMMENVPGLAKNPRIRWMIYELEGMGYKCKLGVFDASKYGVPQRRSRMILVGKQSGVVSFAEQEKRLFTVGQAIGGLLPAGKSGDPLHDFPQVHAERIMQMIRDIPRNGGSRMDLGEERQLPCHKKGHNGFKDIYGRMSLDSVSPTITSGCTNPSKGRFLHPIEDRAITLREAALLQTFPKDYYFSTKRGKAHVALMIGNALPPAFIKRQALTIFPHRTRTKRHLSHSSCSLINTSIDKVSDVDTSIQTVNSTLNFEDNCGS